MTMLYQQWKGSNLFACGGRLIFGPDIRSLCISFVLILAPGSVFCVLVAPHFRGKLPGGVAVLPATIVFLVWDVGVLLWTASRDPGIVPRNLVPPVEEPVPGNSGSPSRGRLPRTKEVIVNGHEVKVKYCDTCMLYRPPRCSHCSICNNCVERFDHHCPWVGQCIGKRNYRWFFAFVVSTTLLCIYVFALSAVYIKLLIDNAGAPQHRTVWQAMGESVGACVLMGYAFMAIWFVGGLTVFHTYLILSNQTTYENFRYRYDHKVNPYNRGSCNNLIETLFSSVPKSRMKLRSQFSPPSTLAHIPSLSHGSNTASARFGSCHTSRQSSRHSSGTRSPATKVYQPLDLARMGDKLQELEKDREREREGREQSSSVNWHDNEHYGNEKEIMEGEYASYDDEATMAYGTNHHNADYRYGSGETP